jgi:hypothetical protein
LKIREFLKILMLKDVGDNVGLIWEKIRPKTIANCRKEQSKR